MSMSYIPKPPRRPGFPAEMTESARRELAKAMRGAADELTPAEAERLLRALARAFAAVPFDGSSISAAIRDHSDLLAAAAPFAPRLNACGYLHRRSRERINKWLRRNIGVEHGALMLRCDAIGWLYAHPAEGAEVVTLASRRLAR